MFFLHTTVNDECLMCIVQFIFKLHNSDHRYLISYLKSTECGFVLISILCVHRSFYSMCLLCRRYFELNSVQSQTEIFGRHLKHLACPTRTRQCQ